MTADPRSAAHEALDALLDAVAAAARVSEAASTGPDRLLSVDEAARALGVGRSALYGELAAGRLRSLKVGRRRLIPSGAIAERVADAERAS